MYRVSPSGSESSAVPGYFSLACFSPDGSNIAFVSDRDGNGEIYIMNIDGSEQVNLTNNPAEDIFHLKILVIFLAVDL
ncbi:MAG: PD40 domain-containing protein [Actinobacteria bacterium]|nr:PD40 domain-containing protein [Actinomycetota bacterium]